MVARVKEAKRSKYRFARRVGRFMAKVTPGRKNRMMSAASATSAQLALSNEDVKDTATPESNGDLVFKTQPLSRHRVKLRVREYRDVKPRFVYDVTDEEIAAAG